MISLSGDRGEAVVEVSHASLLCGASWTENSVVTSLDPPLYARETMFLRGWPACDWAPTSRPQGPSSR